MTEHATIREAIILAGGLGTRLQSVVSDRPKPMAEVEGKPFMAHLMDHWVGQGVDRFVLSVGYMHNIVSDYFGAKYRGVAIEYAVETTALGTGGGLLNAMQMLAGESPFLLLNGDTLFPLSAAGFITNHIEHQADMSIGLARVVSNSRYGEVSMAGGGVITGFDSAPGDSGSAWINAGVYLVQPGLFLTDPDSPAKRVSLERDLIPSLLQASRRVIGYPAEVPFLDIGIPGDYQRCSQFLASLRQTS